MLSQEGRKEGRKKERREGRKGGRKEGRKERWEKGLINVDVGVFSSLNVGLGYSLRCWHGCLLDIGKDVGVNFQSMRMMSCILTLMMV